MKKIGMLVFMMIIMAVVMTAQAKVRTEYRAGGLPPLIIDDSIKDCPNCPSPTEQPSIPVKKVSDSKKHKASAAVVESKQEDVSIGLNVEFDTAKAFIKEEYHNDIKKVADFMKEHPDTKIVIKGHTDSIGKKSYNMRLSRARAKSLRQYLINKFGIDGSRIATIGYGPNKPIASNDTEEGRQKNRRVEAVIEEVKAK
jgi:OOP family OmpA-OmpF porin